MHRPDTTQALSEMGVGLLLAIFGDSRLRQASAVGQARRGAMPFIYHATTFIMKMDFIYFRRHKHIQVTEGISHSSIYISHFARPIEYFAYIFVACRIAFLDYMMPSNQYALSRPRISAGRSYNLKSKVDNEESLIGGSDDRNFPIIHHNN